MCFVDILDVDSHWLTTRNSHFTSIIYESYIYKFLTRPIAQRSLDTGKGKGKGKAIPLQAWTGPEGSRSLRPEDFKTVGT
jgi:hypothetical protein